MIVTSAILNNPNRNFTFLHHLGIFNFHLAPPNRTSPFYFSDSLSPASASSVLFLNLCNHTLSNIHVFATIQLSTSRSINPIFFSSPPRHCIFHHSFDRSDRFFIIHQSFDRSFFLFVCKHSLLQSHSPRYAQQHSLLLLLFLLFPVALSTTTTPHPLLLLSLLLLSLLLLSLLLSLLLLSFHSPPSHPPTLPPSISDRYFGIVAKAPRLPIF